VLTTAYQYSVRGWLTNTLVTAPNGLGGTNTMLNLSVSYFLNGNISQISNQNITNPSSTNPTYTNTYSYDWLNRLASASSTSSQIGSLFASEQYQFDNLSRMTTRTIGGTAYNYTYGNTAHVDAPTAYSYGSNTYSYDAAGNQTSGTVKGVSQTRSVDAENRISSVVTGTTTLSFVYDANGKRLMQSVTQGSSTDRTLYVGNLYEETLSKPGHPYIVYYYLGAKMVGERKGNYSSGNGQYRMVSDHLSSTTLTVDTASPPSVVYRAYYKPYGEVAFQSGASITSVGYTGQRLDGDSGLMYYGARYYDPVLSYFVSPDPTTPDAGNLKDYDKYLYVRGNPLRFIDEMGYTPDDHYIFVEGCVSGSSSGVEGAGCGNPDWGEYMTLLQRIYGTWQAEYRRLGEEWTYGSFDDWAGTHVHNVAAVTAGAGADEIGAVVSGLPIGTGVHLFGHSMGGAAVLAYLNRMRTVYENIDRGELYDLRAVRAYSVRVKSAILIDAADTAMPGSGFGDWAASHGIKVLDVDSPYDWVHHPAISGVEHNAGNYCNAYSATCPMEPTAYSDAMYGIWINNPMRRHYHDYTESHVSEEAYHFISNYWK